MRKKGEKRESETRREGERRHSGIYVQSKHSRHHNHHKKKIVNRSLMLHTNPNTNLNASLNANLPLKTDIMHFLKQRSINLCKITLKYRKR
jgi:hypothetical protein